MQKFLHSEETEEMQRKSHSATNERRSYLPENKFINRQSLAAKSVLQNNTKTRRQIKYSF